MEPCSETWGSLSDRHSCCFPTCSTGATGAEPLTHSHLSQQPVFRTCNTPALVAGSRDPHPGRIRELAPYPPAPARQAPHPYSSRTGQRPGLHREIVKKGFNKQIGQTVAIRCRHQSHKRTVQWCFTCNRPLLCPSLSSPSLFFLSPLP